MDEHPLARHGHFARELEEVERRGIVARSGPEITPEPQAPEEAEPLAETLICIAVYGFVVSALVVISLAAQILYGTEIWPLGFGYIMVAVFVLVLFGQLQNRYRWFTNLPGPRVLCIMSDGSLRLWHRVVWLSGVVLVVLLLVWADAGQSMRLVTLPEAHEAVEEPLNRALALFAMLIALILVIPFQIAVEARRRADKAE